jgi:mono/diheme cytochrome c family protein
MNTSKQINIMILLLFASVLVTGGYTLWDSTRANEADDEQLHSTIRRGAYLFSQNCRTCHGDAGEGGAAADRLREAPALNRADLRGEVDGVTTDVTFATAYKLVYDSISCGRVGKFMPPWAQIQGGTLNDEQIKQLTVFITQGGDEGWKIASEFGRFSFHELHLEGGDDKNELVLAEAIGEDDTVLRLDSHLSAPEGSSVEGFVVLTEKDGVVSRVGRINPNERLSILEEVEEPEDDPATEEDESEEVIIPETIEIMLVTAVDLDANTVTVERGVGGTSAEAHAAGTEVLQPPLAPAEPAVTEKSCGQTAGPPVEVDLPDPTTELTITAAANVWNLPGLSAIADQPLTITVQNNDEGVQHNWVLFDGEDTDAPRIAETPLEAGVNTQTTDFGPLDAGEYYYQCEIHPGTMEGTLTAYPPGQGPDGAATDGGATPAADASDGDAQAEATPVP